MNANFTRGKIILKIPARKTIIYAALILLIFAAAYWLAIPYALRIIYSSTIPEMPELTGYPPSLTEYIEEIHEEASSKPYSEKAVGELGMVYHSSFFYDEAVACYNAAIELNSDEWLWYYYKALISEQLGDTKSTIENLNFVMDRNPGLAHAWFRLGNAYLKQNSFSDAISAFRKVIGMRETHSDPDISDKNLFPLNAYAGLNLALAYYREENYEHAKKELEIFLDLYNRFGPLYRSLGQVYEKLGDAANAKKFTVQAGDFESYQPPSDPLFDQLVIKSRNTDFVLKQIDVARQNGNYDWAKKLCIYVLDYDSKNIDAVIKSIIVSYESQDFNTFRESTKLFFDLSYDNEENLVKIAESLYQWNQTDIALKYLERAITINPKSAEANILYLKASSQRNIDKKLLETANRVLKIDPDNSELRTEYARILALSGKSKAAVMEFKRALSLDPGNEVALILLGVMAEEKGDIKTAHNYYRESIKANPLNVNTILKYGNSLLDQRKWKDAYQLFKKGLDDSPNNLQLLERFAWINSVCPDPGYRNGAVALETAKRVSLMRKFTPRQDIECGITLAASYAETGDFQSAIRVLNSLKVRARQINQESYLNILQKLQTLFESRQPYRV